MITNKQLVEYAKKAVGHPYWYGTFGQISTKALYNAKKKQYPSYYEWECKDNQPNTEPKKQIGVRVFDCVGLEKAAIWSGGDFDKTPKHNSAQDVSANGMYAKCTKKGVISSIPEVIGVLVFSEGHTGIYIGGGKVIEARGHRYGVVETELKKRGWTHWGYCPWVEYTESNPTTKPTTTKPTTTKPTTPKHPTYTVGKTYTLDADMRVRTGAGTEYKQKFRSQLTEDGRKHAKAGIYAVLKKGTRVTIKTIKTLSNESWAYIPSGWICLYKGDKIYVK